MGIASYLSKNFSTQTLNSVSFIGTSAGAPPAIYLASGVNIDDAVEQLMVPYFLWLKSCCLGVLCNLCVSSINVTNEYFDKLLAPPSLESSSPTNNKNSITNSNDRVFIAVSEVTPTGLRKRYLTGGDARSMTVACYASSWIPFLSAPFLEPLRRINDLYYVDGFLSGRDVVAGDGDDDGGGGGGDNVRGKMLVIHPNKFRKMNFLSKWIWLDVEYNRAMYKLGYEDAEKNRHIFDDFFSR